MPLHLTTSPAEKADTVLLAFKKDQANEGLIKEYAGLEYMPDLSFAAKEQHILYHPGQKRRIILLGLGEEKDASKLYLFFRSCIHQLKTKGNLVLHVPTSHFTDEVLYNAVIGLRKSLINNGMYRTNGQKTEEPEITVVIDEKQSEIAHEALHVAESQIGAMKLIDTPSNIKNPAYIASYAQASGKAHGFTVKVLDAQKLEELGMKALLAVGQGSDSPPVCIVMEYKPSGSTSQKPALGLVGKGISFDTGGISIKPSANMGFMKSDMSGAAAVIGAIEAAARLQLSIHVVGVVPAAENSVDAKSMRPGDVIGSYSGKTIEVLDTDAEGRLILADGLSYIIKNHKPEHLIDLATLTGSCIATLGNVAAGIFTKNDQMANVLFGLGEKVNERIWRLPMWEDYMTEMQSDIADIKNLSSKPVAGAITAAKFLEFFVEEHQSWAHLDIAGVAFTESEFARTRTSTGFGIRLLLEYMKMLG